MIQRIQSLFLLGIIICMITLLFTPLWMKESTSSAAKATLTAFSLDYISTKNNSATSESKNTVYLAGLAGLVTLLAAFELVSYKNRIRQRTIGGINSLVMLALLGGSYLLITNSAKLVEPAGDGKFQLGFFLIMIAVILNILANRFIMRDEKLVRSADRMRE